MHLRPVRILMLAAALLTAAVAFHLYLIFCLR